MSARIPRPTKPYPPIQRFEEPTPRVRITLGRLREVTDDLPDNTMLHFLNDGPEMDRFTAREVGCVTVVQGSAPPIVLIYPGEVIRG